MLQVHNVSKWFGDDRILDSVSFTLNAGERAGLIGPNGCGKTTLLDIIAGRMPADSGSVQFTASNVRLGYLEQGLIYHPGQTVKQVVQARQGPLASLQKRMSKLTTQLGRSKGREQEDLLEQYAEAQTQFEALGGYDLTHRMEAILDGLGLGEVALDTPVDVLSGGQKTRLALASLLLGDPNLLLLDEPTNHLDITGLEWLEEFLQRFQGAMLIVSHDRTFLDRTVQMTLEIDFLTQKLRVFPGNYSDYVDTKERERQRQEQAYHEQQEHIARVRGEMRKVKAHAKHIESHTIHFHYLKRARKIARAAVVRERRLQRLLGSEKMVEKPTLTWKMKMDLVDTPVSGQNVVMLENLGHHFEGRFLFRAADQTLQRGEHVALVGANGSGKTTLLRIIAGELAPAKGQARLGANVHLGYYSQEQEGLDDGATPFEEIRAVAPFSETEVRSFLHHFLFAGDDVFVPIGELSYGERARLALAKLVLGGCNLLLLDEPINHLDIPSRESFERALSSFEGTVLIVVHDRYFISRYATALWSIEDGTIRSYPDLVQMAKAR
jgi:ATP-binding cassette subfamily F protein 3